jgi:hypothetical protein
MSSHMLFFFCLEHMYLSFHLDSICFQLHPSANSSRVPRPPGQSLSLLPTVTLAVSPALTTTHQLTWLIPTLAFCEHLKEFSTYLAFYAWCFEVHTQIKSFEQKWAKCTKIIFIILWLVCLYFLINEKVDFLFWDRVLPYSLNSWSQSSESWLDFLNQWDKLYYNAKLLLQLKKRTWHFGWPV